MSHERGSANIHFAAAAPALAQIVILCRRQQPSAGGCWWRLHEPREGQR